MIAALIDRAVNATRLGRLAAVPVPPPVVRCGAGWPSTTLIGEHECRLQAGHEGDCVCPCGGSR